jgi:hypothetical protein
MLRNSATLYHTTQRILPKDMNIYKHCCEKLKIEQDEDTSDVRSFNNVHRFLDSKRLIVMFGYFVYKKKPLGLNYINTVNSKIRTITKEAFNFPFCSFWILLLPADSDLTLQFCGNVAHFLKRRRLSRVLFFRSSKLKLKFPLFYFPSILITSYSSVWPSLLFYRIREELLKWKSVVRLASCLVAVMKRRVEVTGITFEVIYNWASLGGHIDCMSIHYVLFSSVGWRVIVAAALARGWIFKK